MLGRNKKNKQLVLLYGLPQETKEGENVRKVLEQLGVPCREIAPQQLNQKLGYLVGSGGFQPEQGEYEGEAPACSLLILKSLSDKQTDRLLRDLREAGVGREVFKAAYTEHNRYWSLEKLIDEVQNERRIMNKYEQMVDLLQQLGDAQGEAADLARRIVKSGRLPEEAQLDVVLEGLKALQA